MAPTPDFQAVCPFCFELIPESSSLVDLFSGVSFSSSFVLRVNSHSNFSSVKQFIFLCFSAKEETWNFHYFTNITAYLPDPQHVGTLPSSLSDSILSILDHI